MRAKITKRMLEARRKKREDGMITRRRKRGRLREDKRDGEKITLTCLSFRVIKYYM